jgi:hypothetical protein
MKKRLFFAVALFMGMASFTDAHAQTAVMPVPYGKQTPVLTRDNSTPVSDSLNTRNGNTTPTKTPVNGNKSGTVNKNKQTPQRKITTNSK